LISDRGGFPAAESVRRTRVTAAEQLIARRASDPHAYLGAHPDGDGGVVIRAFRPSAKAVRVRTADGRSVPLRAVGSGVFEGALPGAGLPLDYEL
jgi:1,4-alpha-glucan branching enzyme